MYYCITYNLHDLGSVVDTVAGTLVAFAVAVVVVAAAAAAVVCDVVFDGNVFAPSTYKVYYKHLNTT